MTDYKTFGEMSKEEQLALFVAWQEGKEIEFSCQANNWLPLERNRDNDFTFFSGWSYRIVHPKPFFDFSPFDEKYCWAFSNSHGHIFLSELKPDFSEGKIRVIRGEYIEITDIISPTITNLFDPSIPWQESLVAREGVE